MVEQDKNRENYHMDYIININSFNFLFIYRIK